MLKAITSAYIKHATYRNTLNELSRLSNKELYDLGIDRSDIEKVARDSAYGTVENNQINFFSKFFKAKTEKNRIEEYLADSANLIDLENRLKNIDRGLAPWQIRGKSFAQGWMV